MNVFANVKISDVLTPNLNFKKIWRSAISLFIMLTGDSFYEIQKAVSKGRRIDF